MPLDRQIAFDVTHLVSRLNRRATTGIDRVDLAYARCFASEARLACGLHYGLFAPHLFAPDRFRALVERFSRKVREDEAGSADPIWQGLRDWLLGGADEFRADPSSPTQQIDEGWRAYFDQCRMRLIHDKPYSAPANALYLNVAQSGFEFPRFFDWLERRPDILPVFLVHDLLPLDHPEFFRAHYEARFTRRVDTIVRHARAIITTSAEVRDRIGDEYRRRQQPPPPIHFQHLAAPLGDGRQPEDEDDALAAKSYFVMVGTMEPRKNHLMILNAWREFGEGSPKLVLVGAHGWNDDAVHSLLSFSKTLRVSVRNVSGLSRAALRKLIANAKAVLAPSFAEGYGLPVVEALSLGVPTIASDIGIFREVARDSAIFLSPLDGLGWKRTIDAFHRRNSPEREEALRRAKNFAAPTTDDYFKSVSGILANL